MAHINFRNVNHAFAVLIHAIENQTYPLVRTTSRVGDVIQITEPMTITYLNPKERVLFNRNRDANPFFHLMEALWMLAGRNDVAPMAYYSSKIAEIASDDGVTFNGAYGHRWRWATKLHIDQLDLIIKQLKEKPNSRRVVLQMWNVKHDLLNIDVTKDVCCNTNAYFLIRTEEEKKQDGFGVRDCFVKYLDMTVCNRSNDMILGMLGANVVHFSILQEYLAAHIGIEVGRYNQFTNNLHVYTANWAPDAWLGDGEPDYYSDYEPGMKTFPLVSSPEIFDRELLEFNEYWLGQDLTGRMFNGRFREPFFQNVAYPMAKAFHFYKVKDFPTALRMCSEIEAHDWRQACTSWMNKRKARYDNANPMLVNELDRAKKGSEHATATSGDE